MESVVVLPAPLPPSSPQVAPCGTSKRHVVHGRQLAVALGEIFDLYYRDPS